MRSQEKKNTITNKKKSYYLQNSNIDERSIDDTVFLVDPKTDKIFYLNPISTGIWQLLRKPTSVFDATTIVQQAFPEISPKKIAKEVSRFINQMSKRNLVLNDE